MDRNRRRMVVAAGGVVAVGALVGTGCATTATRGETMFGLIGKFTAVAGQRDALIAILLEGVSGMPGCLSYIVAKDNDDADGIWITEVWDSRESHAASLKLPSVQDAIRRGRPLIAGMGEGWPTTTPVGGHGLVRA